MNPKHAGLMAAAVMLAASVNEANRVALRTAGDGNSRRPTPPRRDTALQREIADHNAAVDARKAEKRARKMAGAGSKP